MRSSTSHKIIIPFLIFLNCRRLLYFSKLLVFSVPILPILFHVEIYIQASFIVNEGHTIFVRVSAIQNYVSSTVDGTPCSPSASFTPSLSTKPCMITKLITFQYYQAIHQLVVPVQRHYVLCLSMFDFLSL